VGRGKARWPERLYANVIVFLNGSGAQNIPSPEILPVGNVETFMYVSIAIVLPPAWICIVPYQEPLALKKPLSP
jgi:hypothetical protein